MLESYFDLQNTKEVECLILVELLLSHDGLLRMEREFNTIRI
jgi:hypothetical protein